MEENIAKRMIKHYILLEAHTEHHLKVNVAKRTRI